MKHQQQGVTLVLSLIMLVLLTIMALSSFNIGKSNLQVVDNAQQQGQALNAASTVMDQVVSNAKFAEDPTMALSSANCPAGISAPAMSTCVDLYGDSKSVAVVSLSPAPACLQAKPVLATELNLASAQSDDLGCALGENQQHGIEGVVSGASLCSNTMWELNASASEPVSRAQARVTQGVAMRVSTDAVTTACP